MRSMLQIGCGLSYCDMYEGLGVFLCLRGCVDEDSMAEMDCNICRRALGQQDQAQSDYQAVLSLQTGNKEAETGLASLS